MTAPAHLQQCLTCTRRNIPLDVVTCPACGGVDLRTYDPWALICDHCSHANDPDALLCACCGSHEMRPEPRKEWKYDPEDDGGEGQDLAREAEARTQETMREIAERSKLP